MSNFIEEFDGLMADYLKGDISSEDMQRLTVLLKNKDTCRKRYHELSQIYGIASMPWFEARKDGNLEQLRGKLNFHSSRKRTLIRKMTIWGNVAIWALFICSGITFLYLHKDNTSETVSPVSYCQIEVPQGATSRLVLPDSTIVYLNGGTLLKYDASLQNKTRREVFLATGEAYFEVAANAAKPFIVHAEELNIKVLGTTFNVASYADQKEIKVSLVEGSVNVFTASEMEKNIILSPNEQAVYDKQEKYLAVKQVDATSQTAWTTGRLVFVNETLSDILKKIAKKYDVQLLIQSQKVHTEYFSGNIDADLSLDEILSYIDVDHKFMWKKRGKTVVIKDR